MHSSAWMWVGLIPFGVGLALFAYGGLSPMLDNATRPRTWLTTWPNFGLLLWVGVCLSAVSMAAINAWLAETSERPPVTGQVTYLHDVPVRVGLETGFSLLADDGRRYDVLSPNHIRNLRNGDRVRVTLLAYNGSLVGLEVLSGSLLGYHESHSDSSLMTLMVVITVLLLYNVFAYLVETGRLHYPR